MIKRGELARLEFVIVGLAYRHRPSAAERAPCGDVTMLRMLDIGVSDDQ
ncbi:MAG TPA: hypothetical protein VFM37_09580 [Pseudonocardiaceae bacterium]|nr:hypothetical protein [Pseudonocardiaceae bacterium]